MKFIKGISLFFVYPFACFVLGFCSGISLKIHNSSAAYYEESRAVMNRPETLSVDTIFVIIENDLEQNTTITHEEKVPHQYIGMNRERFLEAFEVASKAPSLQEQEKGFINATVDSFSRERVVVSKNYHSIPKEKDFYVAVFDHKLIVYLKDKQTVFLETEIMLDSLPEELQSQIIDMMYLKDEEALYGFLESYSS